MPDIKKYFRPGFVVVTFVILKQAFGTDDAVFLRAHGGLILLQCFLSLVCTARGLGGTPVRWQLQSRHWESPPPPLNGAGDCVSRTPLFDLLGRIFKPIQKQKDWCKKNLTHRPPSKAAPVKPLSPKHFKASPILAFRPVYPHSG